MARQTVTLTVVRGSDDIRALVPPYPVSPSKALSVLKAVRGAAKYRTEMRAYLLGRRFVKVSAKVCEDDIRIDLRSGTSVGSYFFGVARV